MSTLPRGGISQSPIHAVLQWIWDRSNTLTQLQSCAEKEVESIARDNGISASDFRALVSLGPNASDLLERRMALLDLDPVEVSEIALKPSAICSECAPSVRAIGAVDETLRATPASQNGRIIVQTSKH